LKIVKERRSIRHYTGKAIKPAHEKAIIEYLADEQNTIGINGNKIVIRLIKNDGSTQGKIGTYGMIKHAPAFLSVACHNDKENMVDCGYVFEKMVLFLWELGLGTCWLGGTFHRGQFAAADGMIVPVLSPVGYDSKKLPLKDKMIRAFATSDRRKDFDDMFFKGDFSTKVEEKALRDILKMVRLAPSASNKQPWRLVANSDGSMDFYIERTPGYVGKKLGFDMQMIDIGIAISHYERGSGKNTYYKAEPKRKMLSPYCEYVISVK
jgi:hypothetical protein